MSQLWREATEKEWKARAEAWVPSVRERVEEATSADKAYHWMRGHGLYIPRRFVRAVWRRLREEAEFIPQINRWRGERQIPKRYHRTIHQEIGTNTRYIVEIRGRDRRTGQYGTRTVAIDADMNMTKGEILDESVNFAEKYNFALAGPDFGLHISHAFHASGRGWE